MNVLVINAGSSSLKYQLMDPATGNVTAKGLCERIGLDGRLTHKVPATGKKVEKDIPMPTHKEAIEAVKEARAQGDLSENFEYYAAKKDKNRNESRIRYLENMLKHAKIVSEESRPDEVGMNDTVTLYFEDDDEEEVYRLVTSIRGNSLENRISIESPLGKAIEGHHVGDQVEVKVNDKSSYVVEIRKIEKTGEEDSDRIRSY